MSGGLRKLLMRRNPIRGEREGEDLRRMFCWLRNLFALIMKHLNYAVEVDESITKLYCECFLPGIPISVVDKLKQLPRRMRDGLWSGVNNEEEVEVLWVESTQ